jgi:dTDP-4-amino-4,6-dideoxygalactose transaminase
LCSTNNIPLVEDAAHALGASDHRGRIAGQGTAGACFSFYATKNLTSAEGGALTTDNADLASFAKSYRLHGLSKDAWARYRPGSRMGYDVAAPGIKANLPDVLAAIARSQLNRFDDLQAHRRAMVERYRTNLTSIAGVRCIPGRLDTRSADHLMVVRLPDTSDRQAVVEHMQSCGVGTSVHFQPLHTFTWFELHAEIGPGGTSVADALMDHTLSLPLHSRLDVSDVDRVCDVLASALA